MDIASSRALQKALDLLIDPPAVPDVSKGYLDLLGPGNDAPKNAGVRVLRPGRRIAVMVPTVTNRGPARLLARGGARFFAEDELPDLFERLGLHRVRSKSAGTMQWIRGYKPA